MRPFMRAIDGLLGFPARVCLTGARVRVLLLCAKHLFVGARTVVQGPKSSRGERDRRGLGRLGNHLI